MKTILYGMVLGGVLGILSQAWALDPNSVLIRQELQNQTQTFKGKLICKMPAVNDGQACTVKLQDLKSQNTFTLKNEASARRLLAAGTRFVAVLGTLSGSGALQVKSIEPL